MWDIVTHVIEKDPDVIFVNSNKAIKSYEDIDSKIKTISEWISNRTALIDISGMTHLFAIATIHACLSNGFKTSIVYTEAKSYSPKKQDKDKLVKAWKNDDYDVCENYFQSAALKGVHILPEFYGNFGLFGHQVCLILFVGYKPNKIRRTTRQICTRCNNCFLWIIAA